MNKTETEREREREEITSTIITWNNKNEIVSMIFILLYIFLLVVNNHIFLMYTKILILFKDRKTWLYTQGNKK